MLLRIIRICIIYYIIKYTYSKMHKNIKYISLSSHE